MLTIILFIAALTFVLLSFTIASIITEKEERKTKTYKQKVIVLLVISFVIFISTVKPHIENKYRNYVIVKKLKNNPYYSSLYDYDRELYDKLEDLVLKKAKKGSSESLYVEMRGLISSDIHKRLKYCSDEILLKYLDLLIAQLEKINRIDKKIGYYYISPEEAVDKNIDWEQYYSKEDEKTEYELYADIVKSSQVKKIYHYDKAVYDEAIEDMAIYLFKKYGNVASIIEKTPTNDNDKEMYFTVFLDTHKYIRSFEDKRSAGVFRGMFIQE